jgi:hypothetical protein
MHPSTVKVEGKESTNNKEFPCYVAPCHHGMVCPSVVDEGDSLQMWRIAENISIKQSWTAEEGWSSGLGLGEGLTTPHCKKLGCYKMSHRAVELDGFFGMTWAVENEYEIWNMEC